MPISTDPDDGGYLNTEAEYPWVITETPIRSDLAPGFTVSWSRNNINGPNLGAAGEISAEMTFLKMGSSPDQTGLVSVRNPAVHCLVNGVNTILHPKNWGAQPGQAFDGSGSADQQQLFQPPGNSALQVYFPVPAGWYYFEWLDYSGKFHSFRLGVTRTVPDPDPDPDPDPEPSSDTEYRLVTVNDARNNTVINLGARFSGR